MGSAARSGRLPASIRGRPVEARRHLARPPREGRIPSKPATPSTRDAPMPPRGGCHPSPWLLESSDRSCPPNPHRSDERSGITSCHQWPSSRLSVSATVSSPDRAVGICGSVRSLPYRSLVPPEVLQLVPRHVLVESGPMAEPIGLDGMQGVATTKSHPSIQS